jgi:hypothetical protein
MGVRLFDWRDLRALNRLRHQGIFLDSALALTHGAQVLPRALFSYLAPSPEVFTCVANGQDRRNAPVMGQFIHPAGSQFSHLTFLSPLSAFDTPSTEGTIASLLEYMTALSGERGAFRLLADVDESLPALEALRRCGFIVYTRQRIWKFTAKLQESDQQDTWRAATGHDEGHIRTLYNDLVPALVQQIEPWATRQPKDLEHLSMAYYQEGALLMYVDLRYGGYGIWAQPFVHPDAECASEQILDLLSKIPNRRARPVYVCVRSYQAWLEAAMEELGAEAGPRQAVMAKQLVSTVKAARPYALPALEGGQVEVSAPMAHLENK